MEKRTFVSALLAREVPGSSLAAFRICFGLAVCWHLVKHIWPTSYGSMMRFLYLDTAWSFPYVGFEWVRPWPEPFLTIHFALTALAALCVALGLCYRAASVALFLGFTYIFLLESSDYNNHYYLISLVAFLLIWMPANRCFSVDAWRHRSSGTPALVPFWCVFLLRAQMFIVYFYGGIAKIGFDWLSGVPMLAPASKLHGLLAANYLLPSFVQVPHVCLFLAWGGLIFDSCIGFMMLFRRTRMLGLVLAFGFHFTNNFLFTIGIFPIMALTATLIFFDADWPEQAYGWLRRWRRKQAANTLPSPPASPAAMRLSPWALGFVCFWLVSQAAFPFRHYFVEGDANWTEEHQRFAWRMMLRMKAPGHVLFYVKDARLIQTDARGNPHIDWKQWPDPQANAIYVPIDCRAFSWRSHREMTIAFDACLGERVICNPELFGPGGLISHSEAEQRLQAQWRSHFGRTPEVMPTVSLPEVLANIRAELADHKYHHRREEVTAQLEAIEELYRLSKQTAHEQEQSQALLQLSGLLQRMLHSAEADVIRKHLICLHPFCLQGAPDPDVPLLVIHDSALTPANRGEQLKKLTNGSPYLIWLDLVRMRPNDWRNLPACFVTFEGGGLRVAWNHFRELNWVQAERLAVHPFMIHQYAGRIAGLWREKTGRTPQVAASTLVMLNYRMPQPLVDPNVDLAATGYELFGHNPWILPLVGKAPSLAAMFDGNSRSHRRLPTPEHTHDSGQPLP